MFNLQDVYEADATRRCFAT